MELSPGNPEPTEVPEHQDPKSGAAQRATGDAVSATDNAAIDDGPAVRNVAVTLALLVFGVLLGGALVRSPVEEHPRGQVKR